LTVKLHQEAQKVTYNNYSKYRKLSENDMTSNFKCSIIDKKINNKIKYEN